MVFALFMLFVTEKWGRRVYDAMTVDPSKLTVHDLKFAVHTNTDFAEVENDAKTLYFSIATAVGTLFWGFGDWVLEAVVWIRVSLL